MECFYPAILTLCDFADAAAMFRRGFIQRNDGCGVNFVVHGNASAIAIENFERNGLTSYKEGVTDQLFSVVLKAHNLEYLNGDLS